MPIDSPHKRHLWEGVFTEPEITALVTNYPEYEDALYLPKFSVLYQRCSRAPEILTRNFVDIVRNICLSYNEPNKAGDLHIPVAVQQTMACMENSPWYHGASVYVHMCNDLHNMLSVAFSTRGLRTHNILHSLDGRYPAFSRMIEVLSNHHCLTRIDRFRRVLIAATIVMTKDYEKSYVELGALTGVWL